MKLINTTAVVLKNVGRMLHLLIFQERQSLSSSITTFLSSARTHCSSRGFYFDALEGLKRSMLCGMRTAHSTNVIVCCFLARHPSPQSAAPSPTAFRCEEWLMRLKSILDHPRSSVERDALPSSKPSSHRSTVVSLGECVCGTARHATWR